MCPDLACLCLPWRVGCRTLLAVPHKFGKPFTLEALLQSEDILL